MYEIWDDLNYEWLDVAFNSFIAAENYILNNTIGGYKRYVIF